MPNPPPLPDLKNSSDHIQTLPGGPVPPSFPAHQCRRIDAQLLGHLPLRKTKHFSHTDKPVRKCLSLRNRVVSKEVQDGRNEVNLRRGCVAFPAGNGLFVNPDLVGNLLLEEVQVEATLADVVT